MKFKASDLLGRFAFMGPVEQAEYLNEKIQEWLSEAPLMFCRDDDGLWAADQSPGFARASHTARLVCIQDEVHQETEQTKITPKECR